ncbi:MAG TPA: hypothetical protein VKG82_10685 [Solirubrobacteraceae bacterium]|nr:hypothetical protein [Solirubrobacteraceae bacterium]
MSIDVEAIEDGQRMMWSTGNYPDIAQTIQEVADGLVELAWVQAGERVLDVATGKRQRRNRGRAARCGGDRPRHHSRAARGCAVPRRRV